MENGRARNALRQDKKAKKCASIIKLWKKLFRYYGMNDLPDMTIYVSILTNKQNNKKFLLV